MLVGTSIIRSVCLFHVLDRRLSLPCFHLSLPPATLFHQLFTLQLSFFFGQYINPLIYVCDKRWPPCPPETDCPSAGPWDNLQN